MSLPPSMRRGAGSAAPGDRPPLAGVRPLGSVPRTGGGFAVGKRELVPPRPRRRLDRAAAGVEANGRLTGMTAVALLVLLAVEGLTLLQIRALITPHVFIGLMLIPPVLLKVGATTYRFARYYTGAPAYRQKGPPAPLLRLLGPFVVVLSAVLLASGFALLFVGPSLKASMLTLHKASFVLWFGVMTIHVLAHLGDTARLAPRDWYHRTRRQVAGATLRQWSLVASLALGLLVAATFVNRVSFFLGH